MNKVIGTAVSRKDGHAKVTGCNLLGRTRSSGACAWVWSLLRSQMGRSGRSTPAAERAPGVIAVFTHKTPPKVFKPNNNFMKSKIYEARLPLSDDKVHYAGQIIVSSCRHL